MQRLGKTILISSHILSELGEFCNKIGIIERGKLLVTGTVAELVARARQSPTIVVRVAGDSGKAAAVLGRDGRIARCDARNGALHVTLADPDLHHGFVVADLVAAGVVIDSVAPEEVKLEDVFFEADEGDRAVRAPSDLMRTGSCEPTVRSLRWT